MATPESKPSETRTWSRPLQLVAVFALGVAATYLAVCLFPQTLGVRSRPLEYARLRPLDINSASKPELMQLHGVGDKTADRIVTARGSGGAFQSGDDVGHARGVGSRTLGSRRDNADASPGEEFIRTSEKSPSEMSPTPAPRSRGKKGLPPGTRLDGNRASAEEFQLLDGIGPVIAAKIIEEREKAPFRSPEDLIRVNGIGPRIMDKIRPYITVTASEN